jgi:hypothetical protein
MHREVVHVRVLDRLVRGVVVRIRVYDAQDGRLITGG